MISELAETKGQLSESKDIVKSVSSGINGGTDNVTQVYFSDSKKKKGELEVAPRCVACSF